MEKNIETISDNGRGEHNIPSTMPFYIIQDAVIVGRRPFFEDSINAHRWNFLEISWLGHIFSRGQDRKRKKRGSFPFSQVAIAFGMEDLGNLWNEKGKNKKKTSGRCDHVIVTDCLCSQLGSSTSLVRMR